MKLTKEIIEQIIEEMAGEGYWDDETGDWVDPEEEEEYKGKVRGMPGGRRAMRDIVLPQMQKPDSSKSIERYPPGHPLAGKPVTKGWMDKVWADMQKEKEEYTKKYQQRAKAKGYIREEQAEPDFRMTKEEIVEIVKQEITNILNGD